MITTTFFRSAFQTTGLLVACVCILTQSLFGEEGVISGVATRPVSLSHQVVSGFIEGHCIACHGPEKQEGKLRLDEMPLELSNDSIAAHWQDVLDNLNAGNMPPEDEKQPSKEELTSFLAELTGKLKDARRQLSDQGREVAMRRLNRREYVNSIESLFGFRINPDSLPEDDPTDPFDTIGSQQFFSSYHFEKYLEAGRVIVEDHVYIGDEDGDVSVFNLSSEKHDPIAEINMGNSVYSTPIVANNVLYIANKTHVFAISAPKKE